MTRGHVALSLIVLTASALPRALAAQSCTSPVPAGTCNATTSTTLTIGTLLQLVLSAPTTTLTPPALPDYDGGFVPNNGPTATVRSNRSWTLHVGAAAATWSAVNTEPGVNARANKPASDLQWSTAPGGPFVGLSVAGATASAGGASGAVMTTFYYRTRYNWTLDTPGSYALTVTFTVTAP